jgi:protein tyrosine/serine phosphatase
MYKRVGVGIILAIFAAAVVVSGMRCSTMVTTPAVSQPARPAAWAVRVERPGLPNLFQISDDIYRGAQPTAEGVPALQALHIKTVINLCAGRSDADLLRGSGIDNVDIGMNAWHARDEDVVKFLQTVTDKNLQPVFIHCQHGSDRTGMMCAIYRVAVCGWTKEAAIDEMTHGGFGFHTIWQNLVDYVQDADIEHLKTRAGIGDSPAS